jgi:hypothetical protein
LGKRDGAAWAAEQSVTVHGVRLKLRVTERSALEPMLERLPSSWRPSRMDRVAWTYSLVLAGPGGGASDGDHILYRDETEIFRGPDLGGALGRFEDSTRFLVAESSPQRTFLHAGAVGYAGRAIVLPGVAGTGKTTLTAALVRAGATYLSDEYALIDERGRIHPYPKPLSIVQGRGVPALRQPVEALGGIQETRALPVGLVVLTSFDGQGGRWRPRQLSPGKGVLALLEHTVSAQRRPRHALRRLERVVMLAPVLKGRRGDADATAQLILKRFEGL